MSETRLILDRSENDWTYGHTETRADETSPWVYVPHGEWIKNTRRFWFQKSPIEIMREDMGFDTAIARANEFASASDNDPDIWYYLGVAARYGAGDEALKWIMGAMAAEINTRGLHFTDLPQVMLATLLGVFSKAIVDGRIDRTFTKAVFTELVGNPTLDFEALIAEPRFKPVSADDLEPIIDQIIADNPDQFAKAKINPKLVQFFVGATMKATKGKAPPIKVTEIINRKLSQ